MTDCDAVVVGSGLGGSRSFEAWREFQPGKRGRDYAAIKERIAECMLEEIDRFAPGLSQHVVFRSLATPLTNTSFLHATQGGMYGTEKTLRNLGPFSFPIRTHLDGLFQCGASTFAPGIHGVTTSGLAAAAAAMGCEDDDLLNASGQDLRIFPADEPATWPHFLQPKTISA